MSVSNVTFLIRINQSLISDSCKVPLACKSNWRHWIQGDIFKYSTSFQRKLNSMPTYAVDRPYCSHFCMFNCRFKLFAAARKNNIKWHFAKQIKVNIIPSLEIRRSFSDKLKNKMSIWNTLEFLRFNMWITGFVRIFCASL